MTAVDATPMVQRPFWCYYKTAYLNVHRHLWLLHGQLYGVLIDI